MSLQDLTKKEIKTLWKEFCAIDESKWIDYSGANEQLNYTLNRLNQMPIFSDEDFVFQNQCLAAIFHELYPNKTQPVTQLFPAAAPDPQ